MTDDRSYNKVKFSLNFMRQSVNTIHGQATRLLIEKKKPAFTPQLLISCIESLSFDLDQLEDRLMEQEHKTMPTSFIVEPAKKLSKKQCPYTGFICITDPCYDKKTWCGLYDVPALVGKWNCEILREKKYNRIARLIATHDRYQAWDIHHSETKNIGVDSGQAGIFDSEIYPEDPTPDGGERTPFYEECSQRTLETFSSWGIVYGRGVVSLTGYGDGGYNVHIKYNNKGLAIKVTIYYIG